MVEGRVATNLRAAGNFAAPTWYGVNVSEVGDTVGAWAKAVQPPNNRQDVNTVLFVAFFMQILSDVRRKTLRVLGAEIQKPLVYGRRRVLERRVISGLSRVLSRITGGIACRPTGIAKQEMGQNRAACHVLRFISDNRSADLRKTVEPAADHPRSPAVLFSWG